jgi:histone arginine demethylase JMJD6
MDQCLQAETTPATQRIERRRGLTYAEFERDFLRANKPVILSGCIDSWPAMTKWSPEFFRDNYGTVPVTVNERTWPMAEFVDLILASCAEKPAPYLKDAILRHMSPDLLRDVEPFVEYCFPNWLLGFYVPRSIRHLLNSAQVELFMGGQGTRLGNVHFDYVHSHTVLCQVYGRKEFTLFAPEDSPWLYATGGMSAITNVDAVDLERYPLYTRATPLRFVQEPGEVVFLPMAWWHTTRMLTASIAVGVNFANASNWPAVTTDVCNQCGGQSPLRRKLIRAYLTALGSWKRLQGRRAGARKLGIEPARF